MRFSTSDIADFVELQLASWPLAKKNYDALAKCRRRKFRLGDLEGAWQLNPERIKSTGAAVDKASIEKRPCFLCRSARPQEQLAIPLEPGWEMLVNPYPIFPIHLTIVSTAHVPQKEIPFEIISMAEKLEGMTIFFNGAKAGASAPDHCHMQGVLTSELPLIRLIEKSHRPDMPGIRTSEQLGLDLPFEVISGLIPPDPEGMAEIVTLLEEGDGLVNLFCFLDSAGWMRIVRVNRGAHRPQCYGSGEGEYMISPGSIDMAGVIITPREEDFLRIDEEKTREIYSQTGILPGRGRKGG